MSVIEGVQLPVRAGRTILNGGEPGDIDGEEKCDREEQQAAQAEQEIFRAARSAQGHCSRQDQADGGSVCGNAQARGIGAQLLGDPRSQSLRDIGTAPSVISQAFAVGYSASASQL